MASVSVSQYEKQLECSICLDVFTEPVSTPCGHNYCKGCIMGYWALRDFSQCPLCKETFSRTPELQVNKELSDMLELFNRTRAADDNSGSPAGPADVPCDLCHETKGKALKSCLVCLASYCNTHLQPHHTVQALKWHKLINPVETLEDRVCKKHNKVIEFYCRIDQTCVCVVCLRDDHAMHEVVSLEEEFKDRKTMLEHMKTKVNLALSEKSILFHKIQNSMKQGRQVAERTIAKIAEAFVALEASIKTKKKKIIGLLEEKQKADEQQAEAHIGQLQLEIAENHRISAELEELLRTEDDFRLLQGLPSMSSPSNSKHNFTDTSQGLLAVETMKSLVAEIEEMLSKHVEDFVREVSLADVEETVEEPMDVLDELGKIQEQYAIEATLDPNTAHCSLILSQDRKQVRDGHVKRMVPDNPARFDTLHFVLGNEGFSSGRIYYEVKVKGKTGWEVGVARESITKKGVDLSLSPEKGFWTLGSYGGHCQANANPPVILSLSKMPQKVGVFVDYEGGLVSFYDVGARTLIHSFRQCAFTESAPYLSYLFAFRVKTGTITKTRIYPIFRPNCEDGGHSTTLQITPVRCAKGKQ